MSQDSLVFVLTGAVGRHQAVVILWRTVIFDGTGFVLLSEVFEHIDCALIGPVRRKS
jgi:hypothetical protein